MHLYVKRVFITDNCEALLPDYLRFIKGVVDSSDLPLNVSREILQEDVQIKRIQKNLVGKILSHPGGDEGEDRRGVPQVLQGIRAGAERGDPFRPCQQGKAPGAGAVREHDDRSRRLRVAEGVCGRMPEGQKEIYFITGTSRETLEQSPHLEIFRSKGYEVLFMTDPVDEWVVQSLTEYDGKKLKAVDRGDVELDSEEEKKEKEAKKEERQKQYKDLLEFIKETPQGQGQGGASLQPPDRQRLLPGCR